MNTRKKKFHRLPDAYENAAAIHRQSFPEISIQTGSDCWTCICHKLRLWSDGIDISTKATHLKIAFDRYGRDLT